MFYPLHLGDEAGIRKANEEGNEDNEDGVWFDEGLHPGLAHVGQVGDGEEGEEVGDKSQQETQEHNWVPTSPMNTLWSMTVNNVNTNAIIILNVNIVYDWF